VYASVRCPIRMTDESDLPDRPIEAEKRRNRIARSHNGRAHDLGVICRRTGSSDLRKCVASRARVEIKPGSQTLLDLFHLRKLFQPWLIKEPESTGRQPCGKRLARPRGTAANSRVCDRGR